MSPRLRRGNWSVQELERLRLLLPYRGVAQTAALLRRSPESVQRKAMEILRVPARKGSWTDSDDWQLRQAWGAVELRLLAAMLGRPANEVRDRAAALRQRLSAGPWLREERRLLKKLYGTRTDEDLEVSLMRSCADIEQAAKEMCLAKDKKFQASRKVLEHLSRSGRGTPPKVGKKSVALPRSPMPRWTTKEVEQLRQMYPDHDNLAVANALGRSVTSVSNKAFQLGIHKSAALLASIGRSNIAHRYQPEDLGTQATESAAEVSADVSAPAQVALVSRNPTQLADASVVRSRHETVGVDGA